MPAVLGIDIGTSGARAVLVDVNGPVLATGAAEYPVLTPRPGWSEQDPLRWWEATVGSVRAALDRAAVSSGDIVAVGLAGQMHGLVAVDGAGRPLRPAILWNDQRTAAECAWISERVGASRVVALTGNPVLTGFTAPKIVWMRRHEPERYVRIAHVLLPKDYVRYRLTGELATDVSDASGTSLLDVRARAWSPEMLDALEIPAAWLPRVAESPQTVGAVGREAAGATGLAPGTAVVAGAGDQAAQAVGTGIVRPGLVSATIGTSGVVFAHLDEVQIEPQGRLHAFCHAVPHRWHVMGVMLSAGGSLRWLRDTFAEVWRREGMDPYELMARDAAATPPGAEGLVFLPYLTGERTPHADPLARGAFVGLTLRHHRGHIVRAVLEGVAMGLRDALDVLRGMEVPVTQVRATGGGARSGLWRQVLADVFDTEIVTVSPPHGAAYGAALLAAAGAGAFPSVPAACDRLVAATGHTAPDAARAGLYDRLYREYTALYPALRPAMHALRAVGRDTDAEE